MNAVLLSLALALSSAAGAGEWNFRVLLDGREIGSHRYTLEPSDGGAVLRSDARFDVKFLFVSAYRYDHAAEERWQGGCLESLASRTDTNGRQVEVNATSVRNGLEVNRTAGRDLHAGCVMSFAYWDPRILDAERLLNSQTGELVPVRVIPLGQETLAVRGETRTAERYRISGQDLQIDIWYADGRWVGLEALTDGGRRLRYELQ